jgi:hypothetical protein
MSPEQFAKDFAGEGDHVEFKQGISEHKVREAIAAFSNADGGVLGSPRQRHERGDPLTNRPRPGPGAHPPDRHGRRRRTPATR